ncbi:MAG TPA: proline iminopeptidase-family hydrolase [Rhizomicrobium sp.]|nr:proline iminopeptidase-family hydrolase [Rhizomicrobium sp.]
MKRREFLAAGAAALTLGAAPVLAVPDIKTGGVKMIAVPGGNVWTKRIGHAPIKVLLLHGGPGFSHDYFECFEDFLPPAGIEFYYYDQLGCGNSDHPNNDKLWTIARYTEEVEAVRKALGLDHFILYGHSWGGMLAIEYALKYGQHLSRLVISDMTAGIDDYVVHANAIRAALPAADQATLNKYEKLHQTDAAPYQAVIDKINAEHVLRLPQPWPEPAMRALIHANQHIYNYMQGPNEFSITGTLKHWSRWADLPKIKTPTLVMGAKYDEMDPDQVRREGKLIPNARTWISDKGSHLCMWDDQAAYFNALVPFLKGQA